MERMWANVIGIYLLIGLVIVILNMFLMLIMPVFKKEPEAGRKHVGMRFMVIGSLIGIFVWPVPFLVALVAIKFKKMKRCPGCGSKFIFGFCRNCGPVGKHALLIQEQKEEQLRELNAINNPELRKAALRAYAEVDADPLIRQMKRKMSAMDMNDPARKALLQEVKSAVEEIYLRQGQPLIDEAERRLAEHLKLHNKNIEGEG